MPSLRIGIGGILTECNHFGGIPTDLSRFEQSELRRGDAILEAPGGAVAGMLHVIADRGATPVPLLFASACPGGPVTAECYADLKAELLERLEAALPLDGVLLPLHGAATVEDVGDPEGDLIREVRARVGPAVPIVATLDLHAHVTAEMVCAADGLVAWETYPHRDSVTTGERGATLLLDTVEGRCRPTMAFARVPVITSALRGSTEGDDPFADLMRMGKSWECEPGVLSVSLFMVHPNLDLPGMGSGGLVITDNDPDRAAALATQWAEAYWERRHELEPTLYTPAEAIRRGREIAGGPVILVEAADCCGGGAAGDSTAVLSALLSAARDEVGLAPVVDAEAARRCHAAGEGATVSLSLGFHHDPVWGTPIEIAGEVVRLTDGRFLYSGGIWGGSYGEMGPSAVLRVGRVFILIASSPTYDWKDEQFRSVGLDPAAAKFVVAKNPMNYRMAYEDCAKAMFILDTPGPTPPTLRNVQFRHVARPYFPADADIPGLRPTLIRRTPAISGRL